MKNAKVIKGSYIGEVVRIEGTDIEVFGKSVWTMHGNPAALMYAMRVSHDELPMGGTHYYGKHQNGLGDVFHESELEFIEEA